MVYRKTTFRGFSSVTNGKMNQLYDVDLIKQDLMNVINTRKTERVRNSEFGCKLLDLVFELNTQGNLDAIVSEVLYVISTEPRVKLTNISINTDVDYQVKIDTVLLYLGDEVEFNFGILMDSNTGTIIEVSGAEQ